MRELVILMCTLCIVVPLGLHMTPNTAAAVGLEVYLPLDGNLLDATGNGHNGTWVNGAAGTGANTYVTTPNGTQGIELGLTAGNTVENAETIKTNTDYVAINYTLPDTGTISVWKRVAALYQADGTMDNYNYETLWDTSGSPDSASGGDTWECWIDHYGTVLWRGPDGDDGRWGYPSYVRESIEDVYGGAENAALGQWVNFVCTWEKLPGVATATTPDSMEMRVYVNGAAVEAGATTLTSAWMDPGSTFYLGGGNDGNTAGIGIFDELAIWSEELSDEAVEDLYYYGVNGDLLISIPGDANLDHIVDDADALIVAENWLSTDANWLTGDFNNDDIVNAEDATLMAANWQIGTSAAASVPEPSSLIMLALGCFALLGLRGSRK